MIEPREYDEVILKMRRLSSFFHHGDAWIIRVFCSKFIFLQYKYSLCRVEYTCTSYSHTCGLNLHVVASISEPQFYEIMIWWTSQACEAILDPYEPITFATPKIRFAKVMSFEELRKKFGFLMTLQLFLRDLRIFARKKSR
jgi:hypothetical protein